MKKIAFTIVLVGLMTGCVSPKYNYQPKTEMVSRPPVGEETTAYIGDALLQQGKTVEQDAIMVGEFVKFGLLSAYTMTSGFYVKTGEDNNGSYYAPVNNISGGGSVQKTALADPFKAVFLKKNGEICVVSVFNLSICNSNIKTITSQMIQVPMSDSFQQTLIYNGRVGNKINVGYREFSNDLARPAFSNNVEYDLSESKEIGYKGALLSIVEATNQFIKYKVIRNFNTPAR